LSSVLIEIKENTDEIVRNNATIEVNSSIKLPSDLFAMCKEVITNKQNPKRFAEVPKMCCEVLFAIIFLDWLILVFI